MRLSKPLALRHVTPKVKVYNIFVYVNTLTWVLHYFTTSIFKVSYTRT